MKKGKLLLILLAAVAILLFAASTALAADSYTLRVAGESVSGSASGEGWSWDEDTCTLTLDGFSYEGTPYRSVIYYSGDAATPFTIELAGSNSITQTGLSADSSVAAISIHRTDLIIQGSGSLKVQAGDAAGAGDPSTGISCMDRAVTIRDCTLEVTSGNSEKGSYGIMAKDVTIESGTVTVTGGVSADDISYGIRADNTVVINSGTVTVAGSNAGYWSFAISASNGLTINGGKVNATAGEAAPYRSVALNSSSGEFAVNGGEVTAYGNYRAIDADKISIANAAIMAGEDAESAVPVESYGRQKYVSIKISPWKTLQARMLAGGEISLADITDEDAVTAEEGDTCLLVPEGVEVTLDLAGKTIDRALAEATAAGNVIDVQGILTINDSEGGGTITGGNNTDKGGGITIKTGASVTLNGGSISGNKATGDAGGVWIIGGTFVMEGGTIENNEAAIGAGIYIESGSTAGGGNATLNDGEIKNNAATGNAGAVGIYGGCIFTMNGGKITGNTANICAGVYARCSRIVMTGGEISGNASSGNGVACGGVGFSNDGGPVPSFKISGSPVIIGNTGAGEEHNVHLRDFVKITVDGALADDAEIGVTAEGVSAENPVIATNGLVAPENGTIDNFFSDDPVISATLTGYGEVLLGGGEPHTVTVAETENGTVEASLEQAAEGVRVTLTVTPDKKYQLDTLTVTADSTGEEVTVKNNSFRMPGDDVTVTAVFKTVGGFPSGGGSDDEEEETNEVTVAETEGGSVSVDPTEAAEGDEVTVTAEPEEGKEVDEVKVTDEDGNEIPVTENEDGTYGFEMPDGPVTVEVTFKDSEKPGDKFVDVPADAYYKDAVDWGVENGVTEGVDDSHFAPGESCTRAQMVTFLWRAAGSPAAAGNDNPFTDVAADAYYCAAVIWGVEQGVVEGTSETTFSPDELVTREQIAAFIYRYMQTQGKGFEGEWYFPLEFGDAAAVSEWADEAMHWCVLNDIVRGVGAGHSGDQLLSPQSTASRAEIITMIYRAFALTDQLIQPF